MLAGVRDRWQRDPRPGLLVIVAGVALTAFLALALTIVVTPAFVAFDLAVSSAIRSIRLPGLQELALVSTTVGSFWPMAAFTIFTGAALLARGRKTTSATFVLTVLVGSAFGSLLKLAFGRIRPAMDAVPIPLPETYSFPSGHALASTLFFGALVILIMLNEKSLRNAALASAACLAAALSISMSRVYLGVHYLGDVVGSWLLGIGWLAIAVMVSARWGAGSQAVSEREEAGA